MAKRQDNTEEKIHKVEEALSKTENFIEDNQKLLTIIIIALVIVVLGFFAFKRYYIQPREIEAQGQMWMAEKYLELDSLNKALNGDGSYPGFLAIIDDYSWTKSANLAKYYAGICYLKKGEYQNAIDYLKKYKTKDIQVAAMAQGDIGDAYLELGDNKSALKFYLKSAEKFENETTSPVFLMKAAWTYELMKDFAKAVETYERIKRDYPTSSEANGIEKYIARAKAQSAS